MARHCAVRIGAAPRGGGLRAWRSSLCALLVAGAACSPEREERPPAPPAGGPAVPVAPQEETADALAARWRARVPDSVLIRRGGCPFECCSYREWRADSALAVVASERADGPVLFTIPAGTRFRADSGNVHITDILLIAVADSVGDPPYWSYGPGDTLVVLDPIGEGHFNVWDGRAVKDVEGFWGAERMPLVAEMLGRWETEWWVHVTMPDGRAGWARLAATTRPQGADACAD